MLSKIPISPLTLQVYTNYMFLKVLYSLLAGVFLTLFLGIGIETFYPQPSYNPPAPCLVPAKPDQTPVQIDAEKCNKAQQMLQDQQNSYTMIASSIALVGAVIYFVIGIGISKKQPVFSYAFFFGSIFTLLFSVFRGLSANGELFKFILVSVSLLLVFGIGYTKFVKQK